MKTKKTCLILLLLFIGGGGISAQIMVEYTLQRVLIYHPKDGKNKQHLLLEKLLSGESSEQQSIQQSSFQKSKKLYVKAYIDYKKTPKVLSHDSIIQQHFLYNIEIIYGIFTKEELFSRMHPNDVQCETICTSLKKLMALMQDGVTREDQTPTFFEKMNIVFETLDDSFYQLLIE